MKLAVAGHTNLDVQLQVQELPKPGASVRVLDRRTVWGGTAANIARHAGGLGVPTRLWSRIGDDFPPSWRTALEADGVDLAFLDVARGEKTPTCFILTDLLDRQSYLMDEGPMGRIAEHPAGVELLNGLDEESWLHIATGDPIGYAPLADAAHRAGIPIGFDPGQELRFQYDTRSFEGMLEYASVFFCNEFELRVACDLLRYGGPEQLLDHVDAVVVTRAEKGASLYRGKQKALHVPAFPAKLVDATGAGDAMRAGWYAALREGLDMGAALRWGMAAAAIKVQHPGGQDYVVRGTELHEILRKGA